MYFVLNMNMLALLLKLEASVQMLAWYHFSSSCHGVQQTTVIREVGPVMAITSPPH